MTAIVTVYATFPTEEEARRIARTLVEERLAACANILGPCRSVYRWQGKIEEADEAATLFKTRADLAEALIARLAELHSYDVPPAVVWPIDKALTAYADWVEAETRSS
ncbi:MAG: periplasmic divalent cation tolerance protein [Sphingomonadales bacterium]|nr:periplasmic divalent cation tolerance protein [Sphingomonadales bacterium]